MLGLHSSETSENHPPDVRSHASGSYLMQTQPTSTRTGIRSSSHGL